jgi:hypothetical protein
MASELSPTAAQIVSALSLRATRGYNGFSCADIAKAMGFMATIHGAMIPARACQDPALFATISDFLAVRLRTTR